MEHLECLNENEDCSGDVEYRCPLSGTGRSFPRCDHHWELRLDEQDRITSKYGADSDVAPSWFHGGWGGENEYGERWTDDY
jgi:hypothetical protein